MGAVSLEKVEANSTNVRLAPGTPVRDSRWHGFRRAKRERPPLHCTSRTPSTEVPNGAMARSASDSRPS